MPREHYHFITGRLAEPELRRVLEELAPAMGFDYSIGVMPITVAALITPKWAARRLAPPAQTTKVMVPGYCVGDLAPLEAATACPVMRGPIDLKELPDWFGRSAVEPDWGDYDIEILARIADARQLTVDALEARALALDAAGADVIVLAGGDRKVWSGVGEAVARLREHSIRVALTSRNRREIEAAIAADVELIVGVDSRNCREAVGWGTAVVAVPDRPDSLDGLDATLAVLGAAGVRLRVDLGTRPIGFGFARSMAHYLAMGYERPEVELLLDVSTITETTSVDSASLNLLLLGWCQELRIHSVLVSQESNWTRTAVRECHLARQIVHYAARHQVLPQDRLHDLLLLRDAKLYPCTADELEQLRRAIRDPSYRLFAQQGKLHALAADLHLQGDDPYDLFQQILARGGRALDAEYAFYLGYEMCKAATALALGKNYRQDDALDWGLLTIRELTRRERRALRINRQLADPVDAQDNDQQD